MSVAGVVCWTRSGPPGPMDVRLRVVDEIRIVSLIRARRCSMSSGRIFLIAALSVGGLIGAGAVPVRAQDAAIPVPDVENSKYQASGLINANGVQIRSGA